MKRLLLAAWMALLCGSSVSAQESLFDGNIEHGGFGAFTTKITAINGSASVLTGGWGAWLINHKLALGGVWYNTLSSDNIADSMEMDVDYGGFMAEYIFDSQSLLHYSAQLAIGGGSLDFSRPAVGNTDNNSADDVFFFVEPGISAELNVLSFMRAQLGASYRFVSGVGNNNAGITNSDIGGPALNITLKFGKF